MGRRGVRGKKRIETGDASVHCRAMYGFMRISLLMGIGAKLDYCIQYEGVVREREIVAVIEARKKRERWRKRERQRKRESEKDSKWK